MSLFDTLIVQPIFNILMVIYALLPGHDFGLSIIVFGVLVRLIMWPLIKKQLHQTKVMRSIQPELKKIKARAKGNKQLEGQLMLELYRERGVNPFSSLGVLIIQLPIFIALYSVVRILADQRDRIGDFMYGFTEQISSVGAVVADPASLNESLFGVIDLTRHGFGPDGLYIPLVILALLSATFQYFQSKQITPTPTENKRLRDIMKDAAATGKQVDQAEVSAIMSRRMIVFFPILAFFIALYLPGALVLFYAVSSLSAVVQQHFVLKEDVEEMEAMANKPSSKKSKVVSSETKVRVLKAEEAEVVPQPKKKKPGKNRKKR